MKSLLVLCLAAVFVLGCASLETTAYRSVGTVAVAVDGAMNAWGDYVRTGHATANDEAKVRVVYEKYQAAMAVAERAVVAYKTAPDDVALRTAVRNASLAASAVVELVRVFCPNAGLQPVPVGGAL